MQKAIRHGDIDIANQLSIISVRKLTHWLQRNCWVDGPGPVPVWHQGISNLHDDVGLFVYIKECQGSLVMAGQMSY